MLELSTESAVVVSMRTSWALANSCAVLDLVEIGADKFMKMLIAIINYNFPIKEKIVSSSIRALRYIILNKRFEELK